MVGKNNFKNKMQAEAERKPHYGIRKFSIGVASVLLSTSLYFGISTLTSNYVGAAVSNIETTQDNKNDHNDFTNTLKQENNSEIQVQNDKVQTVKNDDSSNSDKLKKTIENNDSEKQNGGYRSFLQVM